MTKKVVSYFTKKIGATPWFAAPDDTSHSDAAECREKIFNQSSIWKYFAGCRALTRFTTYLQRSLLVKVIAERNNINSAKMAYYELSRHAPRPSGITVVGDLSQLDFWTLTYESWIRRPGLCLGRHSSSELNHVWQTDRQTGQSAVLTRTDELASADSTCERRTWMTKTEDADAPAKISVGVASRACDP